MATLKELVKDPSTIFVDVRSPWEFEAEHIPGARNIPLEQIPYKADEFKAFQHPVVVYCRSGARSGMALGILQQIGIPHVFNGGGIGDVQFLLNK